jgi:flagellar hook protein FlgE
MEEGIMGSSMNSAVSGLRAHQLMLDVVGNNIANINTPGFKASRTTFADVLSQTLSGATAPAGSTGGTNAQQVGLGVRVGAISNQFTQGGLLTTSKPTDLAIQGEGFFTLSDGAVSYFTRAGAFELDGNGYLVDSITGYRVQGAAGDIQVSPGAASPPMASTTATFTGNLDATVAVGTTYVAAVSVYDSLGGKHNLSVTFTKTATAGEFTYSASEADGAVSISGGGSGTIRFDGTGAISAGGAGTVTLDYTNGANNAQAISLDFGSSSNTDPVRGLASASTLALARQDGYTSGTLQSFSIGADGNVNGVYSNGDSRALGIISLATFSNPSGLSRSGNNLFRESVNSGVANLGVPSTGGRGSLAPGSLEGSNVDLADEFTKLIVAQRGFQANARVISTSDEVMMEAVNLKR